MIGFINAKVEKDSHHCRKFQNNLPTFRNISPVYETWHVISDYKKISLKEYIMMTFSKIAKH